MATSISKISRLRPPSLSSTGARRRLGHRQEAVYNQLHHAIDNLASLYDGLDAVRTSQSPLNTPEANAITYKKQYDAAIKRAEDLVNAQISRMVDHEMNLRAAAMRKAGLDRDPPNAVEVRAALRGMTQKERDAAVTDALQRGDVTVIAAIAHSPSPIVTGQVTIPLKTLTKQFVERTNPELVQDLEDAEFGIQALGFAWQDFQKGSANLRDIGAETSAEQGVASAQAAASVLDAAMQGVPAKPIDTGGGMERHDAAQAGVIHRTEIGSAA